MQLVDPISCTMTSTELDQASRTHFALTDQLIKEIQARRAAEANSTMAMAISEQRMHA